MSKPMPGLATVIFGSLARATVIVIMMALAASAASFCPTAQAPCHMMDDGAQEMGDPVCVLACGVLLGIDIASFIVPSEPFEVTRDFFGHAFGGLDIEPDVPPPRVSV